MMKIRPASKQGGDGTNERRALAMPKQRKIAFDYMPVQAIGSGYKPGRDLLQLDDATTPGTILVGNFGGSGDDGEDSQPEEATPMAREVDRLAKLELVDSGRPVPPPGPDVAGLAHQILSCAINIDLIPYQVVPSVSSTLTFWFHDGNKHGEIECFGDGYVLATLEDEADGIETKEWEGAGNDKASEIVQWLADSMELANLKTAPIRKDSDACGL